MLYRSRSVYPSRSVALSLTFGCDDSGSHHVALVAHEDDRVVSDESLTPEEAERVFSRLQTGSVCDGVHDDTGVRRVCGEGVLSLRTKRRDGTDENDISRHGDWPGGGGRQAGAIGETGTTLELAGLNILFSF